ncbi:L,D-transpeptidase family protein [Providencia sp. PROV188]|uniref:L,D-transpeptidase family protein n=1 Tax=Providencia TaxID=586 RepID=UPI0003E2B90F|nr:MULTISPECIES: L,D-transpeptidase family protein [Providencia]ETT01433.1 putative peptidase [Providencia alcalifaciens PAL-3]EUD00309.1 putative peptidase [Providencia alcalifaciens PAL-1]MBG5881884.1 L,D-transpeptidase family protein [Providencia alcalifaciens]MBS0926223.1 L,D-transpeptidase family protein [Providencia sp. JGM181]MBS0932329.1 L,D-transpeptidase family protein [Providencia sp. JGM172]
MKRVLTAVSLFVMSAVLAPAQAKDYPLPNNNTRLIGENITYVVPNDGRPLEAIASDYQIGLLAMLEANPGTDPYLPEVGKPLIIPAQMLLPSTPRTGIVINLAEMRLYYYPENSHKVAVYPIGIGQLGRDTPEMVTSISQLIKDPTWTPTTNIRKHYAQQGITLPAVVPAGPENPMGLYALRLSYGRGEYLIHGTNANFGIGMRVSSGCIRLRPDDIKALFTNVPKGTRVQVIDQPVKYAKEPDGSYYIEVHQPLSRKDSDDPQTMPIKLTEDFQAFLASNPGIDKAKVQAELSRRSGLPVRVNVGDDSESMKRDYQQLKPIAPFTITQPQPVFEGEVKSSIPAKYQSFKS